MNRLNVNVTVKNAPVLDPDFLPIGLWNKAFLKTATKDVAFALERENGQVAVCRTKLHGTAEMAEADRYYADRLVKCMLWQKGGFKVYVTDETIYRQLKAAYAPGGSRAFDADFMSTVYEQPFEVVLCEDVPEEKGASQAIGRHLGGCRIGFDAGGSDRKVSAVIDGVPVYSEETVWFPKITADPDYHYDGIVAGAPAMRTSYSNLATRWVTASLNAVAPRDAAGKAEKAVKLILNVEQAEQDDEGHAAEQAA